MIILCIAKNWRMPKDNEELEVRETQKRAIQIYHQAGFKKSGENPKSVLIKNKYYSGYYFYKDLI